MARKMKKFSEGGAQGRYDRRMADIEKDFKKAMTRKTGKDAEVAEAKRQQRIADAKDDLAKRTGADRTATRAAERAAESNLTKTRKFGAPQAVVKDTGPVGKIADTVPVPKMDSSIGKPQSFAAAFKDARARLGAGKTFTYNGKKFTTNMAGEDKGSGASKPVQKSAQQAPAPASGTSTRAQMESNRAAMRRETASKQAELTREANRAAMRRKAAGVGQLVGPANTQEERIRAAQRATSAVKPVDDKAAKLSRLKVAAEAPGATQYAKDRYKYAMSSGMYAKGGAVKEKGKVMMDKKKKSMPPQPTAADRASDAKFRKSVKDLKVTPENAAAIGRGNRSTGYKKGGKMAPKFGAALVKKSADTKGRAMVKKAGGGKCYAKGGSIDGCAVKGKTKGKMV